MIARELTAKEKRIIAQSVMKNCANYDREIQECLPENAVCQMMTIGYNNSNLCRYYLKSILPNQPEVIIILYGDNVPVKICSICGNRYIPLRNQKYCSLLCSETARKKATALRVKKYAEKRRKN